MIPTLFFRSISHTSTHTYITDTHSHKHLQRDVLSVLPHDFINNIVLELKMYFATTSTVENAETQVIHT